MSAPTDRASSPSVAIVVSSADPLAGEPPVPGAVPRLADVLNTAGVRVDTEPAAADLVVHVGGNGSASEEAEAFEIARPDGDDGPVSVTGGDARGLMYGVLELADRARYADDPVAALRATTPTVERPATPVRSVLRAFVSDVEDKPWFYDREFWTDYLTELAENRVNRVQLALGMQYNFGHHPATENYLCFPYPFLLDVAGFDVQAGNVSAAERERNLATLRFVSDEAKRRGIHFQLGLWNHADDQGEGSVPRYPVTGVTPENHADYCAAALGQLLRECPSIAGLTMRVHYEGGIPEPDHEAFWAKVMTAIAEVGRPLEIDMHAKGVDAALLDIARGTGCRVVVSAKYWAEHQGLPYHQTTIRVRERATKEPGSGLMAITAHQRRFTRYGYGDFLREHGDVGVLFRIWPGTQKVLLWGDPELAAGYGRHSTIGGAVGVELCEPLTFKGRKDTGEPGGRDPYADPALRLGGQEWRKYRYTYRLWGRLLYNPDADPEQWRRFLRAEYGANPAAPVEQALAAASRILPLVTTVHGIGASNNGYWPEMYVNMPIAGGPNAEHYKGDTVQPPTFGGVSSFDPSMFCRVDEYADDAVAGSRDGRYTPAEVSAWLEELAATAEQGLETAEALGADPDDPVFRRLSVDVRAQAGLGRFFAGKFRAGVAYALYERTNNVEHADEAVDAYRAARDAWVAVVLATDGVYRPDLTFGDLPSEHGHWADRLPAIQADLAALERWRTAARAEPASSNGQAGKTIPAGTRPELVHMPPGPFERGEPVMLTLTPAGPSFDGSVTCHYRHLNQGEDYETVALQRDGDEAGFEATIPGAYTDSDFALAYYFVVHAASGDAWILPGFGGSLANQPYHVLRQQ